MMDYLISRDLAKLYTLDGKGRLEKKAFAFKNIVNVVKGNLNFFLFNTVKNIN